MSRSRYAQLLVQLARLPWWVSVLVASMVFATLRWLAPQIMSPQSIFAPLGRLASANAWWLAAIFLLPVPFAIVRATRRRQLVENPANIETIRALSWQEFEQLVAEAYRRKGYSVKVRGGAGADGGIDLDLRVTGKTLVVQCKRWKTRTVGVNLVRELYGAMAGEEAHGAIFVTSGGFTPDAIDFARDKPVKLIDGRGLVELLKAVQPKAMSTGSDATSRAAH